VIQVWRIGYCASPQPSTTAILGTLGYGSTLANGRWHSLGPYQVIYAGSSRALCQLEKRVHSNGSNPKDQALMRLELPDGAVVRHVEELGLPADWRTNQAATQSLGMAWLAQATELGLWVPSYIEPSELNLLINPTHPQYSSIKLTVERIPFGFDPRLF